MLPVSAGNQTTNLLHAAPSPPSIPGRLMAWVPHHLGEWEMARKPTKNKRTLSYVADLIAGDLRAFGYPNVTSEMVKETWAAMKAKAELPHGVVGMFNEDA